MVREVAKALGVKSVCEIVKLTPAVNPDAAAVICPALGGPAI